jgi:hypothetical protein
MMSGAVLFASVFGFVVTSELALRILEPSFVSRTKSIYPRWISVLASFAELVFNIYC